jgi:pyruvate formate lyase activating enzyme
MQQKNQTENVKGNVFDIQRFSVHDGPGIRTVVFLKGCSLHCFWCQNPEGILPKPEIMFFPDRCILCGRCVEVCPEGAHTIKEGVHYYIRDKCTSCGRCAEVCYAGTLKVTGKIMTVKEVIKEVLKDKVFYEQSGGGITLSGGDAVVQHRFANAILKRSKVEGLHTAIETAANCKWEVLESLLPLTDLVMMDIKHLDLKKHKEATRFSNELILQNAQKLSQTLKPLIIRTPVIPGVNDTQEEIAAIVRFIQSFPNLKYYELLPFHRFGEGKHHNLGLSYAASHLKAPPRDTMNKLADEARKFGIQIRVAS